MSRYFSKLSILVLVFVVLFAFGCSNGKNVEMNEGQDGKKPTQTDSQKEDQAKKAEEEKKAQQLEAERLEQKRLEEQKKLEQIAIAKKEARDKFENVKIYFNFDSSELSESSQKILEEKAEWLSSNPDARITIEGHCDERGTTEYNIALGERRADSARKFLKALGVDGSRIKTTSYGEENPAMMGSGEEVWSKNRRGEFIINSGSTY